MRSSSSARRRTEPAEILASLAVLANRIRAAGAGAAAGCAEPSCAGRSAADMPVALYGRKIDRERLIRAITSASREQKKALTALRSRPDFDQMYKFGAHDDPRPSLHPPGRLRRHVQDLSRGERARGHPGGAQGIQPGSGRLRADRRLRPLPPGIRDRRRPESSEHRAHLRSRHRRRSCLHRHGAFPGRRSAAAHESAARAADRAALSRSRSRARSTRFMPSGCCTGT